MANYTSITSPTDKSRKPNSFPKILSGLTLKSFSETNCESPTSTLDGKPFSTVVGLKNPFGSEPITNPPTPRAPGPDARRHQHCWHKLDSRGIVDALSDTDPFLSKTESRMVLFGSRLKIRIPDLLSPHSSLISPLDSPKAFDFGIKTRNSELGSFSSSGLSTSPVKKSVFGSVTSGLDTPRFFAGCASTSEMEMSEDYTCVITHGPNSKTTHIFDNCIVGFSASREESSNGCFFSGESFLSFCYSCKKNLAPGKDIFMYRGEKAFCSSECRDRQIMLEEGMGSLDSDGTHGASSK